MPDAPPSLKTLLDTVLDRLPGVRRAVAVHGRESMARYFDGLRTPGPAPLQPSADLVDAAHARTRALLGEARADALADALSSTGSALTANHHGLDCLAQSVQGVLAYATGFGGHCPVLACAMVPLSSFSYPRGLGLARTDPERGGPLRIPIFPSSMRYVLVHCAPPLTPDMAGRAASRVAAMADKGLVSGAEARFMARFLEEDCLDPAVQALPRYADQAVVLQARLMDRLLPEGPGVTVLSLEDLVGDLLRRDLARDGLASALCLDGRLRGLALQALDGVEGCWNLSLLDALSGNGGGQDERAGAGTALFWGLDAKGRRVPMACREAGGRAVLTGRALASGGHDAEALEVPLEARALTDALDRGRLAPGLFLSYAVVGFARGLRCCGGVFQSDYLGAMRDGLAEALRGHGAASEAGTVQAVEVDNFAAGPEAAFVRDRDGLRPAGLVEMAAAGSPDGTGLTPDALAAMGRLTLRQGLMAGLVDLTEEFVPADQRPPGWRADLAAWLHEQPGVLVL